MLDPRIIPTRLDPKRAVALLPVHPIKRLRKGRFLFVLYHVTAINALLLLSRVRTGVSPQYYARKIRRFFERMGPVWVQAGRVLAMRSDVLPEQVSKELASLRDTGRGFPFDYVRQTIEQELGVPLEHYFKDCDELPFAVSSSFQVHRAVLKREGVMVAIKVQRPDNEEICRQDLNMVRRLVRLFRWLGIAPNMRWKAMLREVEHAICRELDFRFEASALEQLAETLPKQNVYVPHAFTEYSTRRVLVSEFIQGVTLAQFQAVRERDPDLVARWSLENGVDTQRVARRLFHSIFQQIFEDNFFHADMHPSNVILLRDSRLAVIDCRAAGSLEADQLAKYRMYFAALSRREFATAAEHSFLFSLRLPRVALGEVKSDFVRVWRQWEMKNNVPEIPVDEKSLTWMLDQINRIVHRNRFEAQWSMAKLVWALINADASVRVLVNRIDYLQWLSNYFQSADRRLRHIDPREAARGSVNLLDSIRRLPKLLMENSVAQQEILRRQSQAFRGTRRKSSIVVSVIYGGMKWLALLVAGMISCTYVVEFHDANLRPWLGEQIYAAVIWMQSLSLHRGTWLFVLLALFLLFARLLVLQRRSRQSDVQQLTRHMTEIG